VNSCFRLGNCVLNELRKEEKDNVTHIEKPWNWLKDDEEESRNKRC